MMRVLFQPGAASAPLGLTLLVLLSACSSAPVKPTEDGAGEPNTATGGSQGSQSPSGGPAADSGNYHRYVYPAGPYGVGVGATLENFAFQGWLDPVAKNYDVTQLETIRMSEFYDPDGSKNRRLIWINASAVWCSVCRHEMEEIKNNGVRAAFEPRGVQLVVTLFQDGASPPGPSTPMDLHNWGSVRQHAIDFPLLLDPGFKLGAFFTSDATPLNLLVDARTMRVIEATMGYSDDYWQRIDAYLGQ